MIAISRRHDAGQTYKVTTLQLIQVIYLQMGNRGGIDSGISRKIVIKPNQSYPQRVS